VVRTWDNVANLKGLDQVMVSDPMGASSAKRGLSGGLDSRQGQQSLVQINSGLGNQVTVINADQPFSSGLIQVTTG
jgi:hypothetical protein